MPVSSARRGRRRAAPSAGRPAGAARSGRGSRSHRSTAGVDRRSRRGTSRPPRRAVSSTVRSASPITLGRAVAVGEAQRAGLDRAAQQRPLVLADRAGSADGPESGRRSRRRSRAARHRCRPSRCRSSARWRDQVRKGRPVFQSPSQDLIHHPAPRANTVLPMSQFKSDFLRVLSERGFIHQVSEPDAARRAGARPSAITAYIGFDCTAASPACRLAAADHDAALDAADRPPADRADGRRHHPGRRSFRQGREPQHPDRRR